MKRKIIIAIFSLLALVVFYGYGKVSGLFSARLQAPAGTPYVKAVPDNWPQYQAERTQLKEQHLQKHAEALDHFTRFAVSETDGIPLIVLKLLPEIAPEFWGEKDNFLSAMGLFYDERFSGFPFPQGIGFSGMSRKDAHSDIDYASFTCAGCHIGRVRNNDGQFVYLDGGVNSEFDVIGYRWRIVQTLNKIYGDETDPKKKTQLVIDTFLSALDKVSQNDPNYFYNNYTREERAFDQEYERQQIALFKSNASTYITTFMTHQEGVYNNWRLTAKSNYPEIEERILKGFPGMEDAIGFNAVAASQALKKSRLTSLFSSLPYPKEAGITDIMVIWEQDTRNPRWNEDKTDLINGGGQWNGHIPLPMYKNMAAQITLGFDNIDVSVSAFADELIDKLPATVYPFEVDIDLAKKGQALFAENCAGCHQPNNGKVYRNIGTDMGRALISGTVITLGAQLGFTTDDRCSPKTTIEMYGKPVKPCAVYRGVSMEGKNKYAMTAPRVHDGYNALPLVGIWAQAPYLHTGGVPTLYHMLIPSERPGEFIKSRLDYDTEKVGFSWDPNEKTEHPNEGYLYKPASSPAIGNTGHDKDIVDGDKTFKLNWEDDKAGAMALIEYLKTI